MELKQLSGGLTLPAASLANLSEATSWAMLEAMQSTPVACPEVAMKAIATTYVQEGQGQSPPVLLVHGFDSSLLEYRRLYPQLSQSVETWAVDLFGFGFTARPAGSAVTPASIKAHLRAFWEQHIKCPVVLVGASMGGAVALDLALSYPEMVERLVLIDSAGFRAGPLLGKFLPNFLGRLATEGFLRRPNVRQKISENAYFDPQYASADAQCCAALHLTCDRWAEALISFTQSGGYGSFRDRLSDLNRPTLILWGRQDRILGTKDAEPFQRAIPGSQLEWIEQCGHVPHLERADVTAASILRFIGR